MLDTGLEKGYAQTKEVGMKTKVEMLSQEALSLAVAMLKNEYSQTQSYFAVDRIQEIIKEIGGSRTELVMNAEKFIKAELEGAK